MRLFRTATLFVVLALALFPFASTPAWANGKKKIRLTGMVVSIDTRGGSFQLQEFGERAPRWVVVLHREAEIEADDDDRRVRHLAVGDVVEVKADPLGDRTVLAKKVKILGHTTARVPAAPPQQAQPPASGGGSNFLVALVKTLGIGAAVVALGPALNTFINGLLQNRGAAVQAQTKVVPILSLTIGISAPGNAHIGAAQVAGPAAALERVQAVALLEADYQTAFRAKIYVPVDNLKPWEAFRRVPGVGVSAIIDIRI